MTACVSLISSSVLALFEPSLPWTVLLPRFEFFKAEPLSLWEAILEGERSSNKWLPLTPMHVEINLTIIFTDDCYYIVSECSVHTNPPLCLPVLGPSRLNLIAEQARDRSCEKLFWVHLGEGII